jgi:hypothetical protein
MLYFNYQLLFEVYLMGFLNYWFNSQELLKQFEPEEQQRIKEQAKRIHDENPWSIKQLSQNLSVDPEAFQAQEKLRAKSHKAFKTGLEEKDDTLDKLLKDHPKEVEPLVKIINNIFDPQNYYSVAQRVFEGEMEAFQQRLKSPPDLSVAEIENHLQVINNRARKAIQAQQKHEKEALEKEALPIATELAKITKGDAKAIEENLKADLAKAHKEQLDAFDKSSQENHTALHKAAAEQDRGIQFAGVLNSWAQQQNNSNREKMLEEMREARKRTMQRLGIPDPNQNTMARVNLKEGEITDFDPNDLKFIISLTGSKIEHLKPGSEPGKWTVKLGPRILNPLYYLSNKEKPKIEALSIAQAVKACGYNAMTMTVNFDDPVTQKERAKQAYEAMLEVGFDPGVLPGEKDLKGINMVDGQGNPIDIKKLFADEPDRLARAEAKGEAVRAKLNKEVPRTPAPEAFTKNCRDTLTKAREAKDATKVNLTEEAAADEEVKKQLGTT